jgi:hypothetical protein
MASSQFDPSRVLFERTGQLIPAGWAKSTRSRRNRNAACFEESCGPYPALLGARTMRKVPAVSAEKLSQT